MKKIWKEFKEFAFKGNVIDMAVGVMIGSAFSKIVTSLVNDLVMPLLSLLTGGTNVSGQFLLLKDAPEGVVVETIEQAKELGLATFNYGNFIQTVIDFVLIALSIFLAIRLITKLHKKKEEAPAEPAPAPRLCPFCCKEVDKKATRCPHCTSQLPEPEEEKKILPKN